MFSIANFKNNWWLDIFCYIIVTIQLIFKYTIHIWFKIWHATMDNISVLLNLTKQLIKQNDLLIIIFRQNKVQPAPSPTPTKNTYMLKGSSIKMVSEHKGSEFFKSKIFLLCVLCLLTLARIFLKLRRIYIINIPVVCPPGGLR